MKMFDVFYKLIYEKNEDSKFRFHIHLWYPEWSRLSICILTFTSSLAWQWLYQRPVFGMRLTDVLKRKDEKDVPRVVEESLKYLSERTLYSTYLA